MNEVGLECDDLPGSANYVLCIIGSLYTRIIVDWELADMKNPAHGVRRFKMKTRERFLTPEERAHVEEVLLRSLQISHGSKGHIDRMGVWALPRRPLDRRPRRRPDDPILDSKKSRTGAESG